MLSCAALRAGLYGGLRKTPGLFVSFHRVAYMYNNLSKDYIMARQVKKLCLFLLVVFIFRFYLLLKEL